MSWLKSLLGVLGSVVDTALPFAVGHRTELLVAAASVSGVVATFCPAAAPIAALLASVAAKLAPLTAVASIVREK